MNLRVALARSSQEAVEPVAVTPHDRRDVTSIQPLDGGGDEGGALQPVEAGDGRHHGSIRAELEEDSIVRSHVAADASPIHDPPSEPRRGALGMPELIEARDPCGEGLGREMRGLCPITHGEEQGEPVEPPTMELAEGCPHDLGRLVGGAVGRQNRFDCGHASCAVRYGLGECTHPTGCGGQIGRDEAKNLTIG